MVEATIVFTNGTTSTIDFSSFKTLSEWCDERKSIVYSVVARTITAGQIKQGRVRYEA